MLWYHVHLFREIVAVRRLLLLGEGAVDGLDDNTGDLVRIGI